MGTLMCNGLPRVASLPFLLQGSFQSPLLNCLWLFQPTGVGGAYPCGTKAARFAASVVVLHACAALAPVCNPLLTMCSLPSQCMRAVVRCDALASAVHGAHPADTVD